MQPIQPALHALRVSAPLSWFEQSTAVFALCGMIAGMGVMLGWYASGLSRYMYEILPGFAAGLAVILFMNYTMPQRSRKVLREYDSMLAELRSER